MFTRKLTLVRNTGSAALVVAAALALGVSTGSAQANPVKGPPHTCGVYYKYTC
jgi:hypothetical protein